MDTLVSHLQDENCMFQNKSCLYQIHDVQAHEILEPSKHQLLVFGAVRWWLSTICSIINIPIGIMHLILSFENIPPQKYSLNKFVFEVDIEMLLNDMKYNTIGHGLLGSGQYIQTPRYEMCIEWKTRQTGEDKHVFIVFNCFKFSNKRRQMDKPSSRCEEFLNACIQFCTYNNFAQLVKFEYELLFRKISINKMLCRRIPYCEEQFEGNSDDCCTGYNYSQVRSLVWTNADKQNNATDEEYDEDIDEESNQESDEESDEESVDDNQNDIISMNVVKYKHFTTTLAKINKSNKKLVCAIAWKIQAPDPVEKMYLFLLRSIASLSYQCISYVCWVYERGITGLVDEYQGKNEEDGKLLLSNSFYEISEEISTKIYEIIRREFDITIEKI
eukprot:363294_1